MARRKHGQASIEEHPAGSGKFRVRARIEGKLRTVASGKSEAEAEEIAGAYTTLRNAESLREGITLRQFGAGFLSRRKARGSRTVREDRNRWAVRVEADPIAEVPIAELDRGDVLEWMDRAIETGLRPQTIRNALNLLRLAIGEARDRRLCDANPAEGVRVPRRLDATDTEDLDGVLTPEEQMALLSVVPAASWTLVVVALLTGLRWSELAWLRWEDIGEAELTVRRSRGGKPTKGGKPRRVPLFGPAIEALKVQRERVEKACPWVFPNAHGKPSTTRPRAWTAWLRAAGITRRVRWHDLRHTCGTALLAGWWGPAWSKEDVQLMLGHSSITTTERYAKLLDERLTERARQMFPIGNKISGSSEEPAHSGGFLNRWSEVRLFPGAPSDSDTLQRDDAPSVGTTWELPASLERALNAKPEPWVRPLAKAYVAAFERDEAGMEEGLREAAELLAGGKHRG